MTEPASQTTIELLDWRRRVADLYHEVRALYPRRPSEAHQRWRAGRDELIRRHSQTPLAPEDAAAFTGLNYYPYDAGRAFTARIEPASAERLEVPSSTGGTISFTRFGELRLPVGTLAVYWLECYGGGLFLPFRDSTAGTATYGGGRYLLDTVKGADLGVTAGSDLVIDFNFAYSPSCHYRHDWTCPLPPPENWLSAPIDAGETLFTGAGGSS
jgi:uncharacterized protein